MPARPAYKPALYGCDFANCKKKCKTPGGLTRHKESCSYNPINQYIHSPPSTPTAANLPFFQTSSSPPSVPQTPRRGSTGPPETPPTPSHSSPRRTIWTTKGRSGIYVTKHPFLDGMFRYCLMILCVASHRAHAPFAGHPCDENGYELPEDAPPPPREFRAPDDYFPFTDEDEFHFADFLFTREQMSAGNTDILMSLIAAWQNSRYGESDPPFSNSKQMRDTIDSIPLGDVPWEGFKVSYDGEIPDSAPSWMMKEYEVWFRNPLHVMEGQIGNPDFAQEIDVAPKKVLGRNKKRQFTDLMSADWAWEQAVCCGHFVHVS